MNSIKKLALSIASSKFIKNSGIYAITNIVSGAIPFLLIPIITKNMPPEDYGTIAMFMVLVGFSNSVIGLNVHGAVLRSYYDQDEFDFPKYVFNSLIILFTSAFFVVVVIIVFGNIIEKYASFPKSWFIAVIFYSFFQFIGLVLLAIWQAQKKALQYGIFIIARIVLDLTLSIVLILYLNWGWEGRIVGQLTAITASGLLVFIILINSKLVKLQFDWAYIKNALNFGIPLIPHTVGLVLFTMTDRIFITNMIGVKSVGIYFIAYQIGQIIYLFSDAFNKAWVPWFYEKLKSNLLTEKIKIVKITYIYFIVILVFALTIFLITPLIFKFFIGKEYLEAEDYVIWFLLGFAFNGMYKMVCNYMFYLRKTKIISSITFIAGTTNVILNYFLIKEYGIVGAAQASTISFLLSFVLTWIYSSRVYKMPWNLIDTTI